MSYVEKIGANIRAERIKRNISTDELAEMLGLTSAFIGLIERGQRGAKLSNLIKICDIFGVTLNDIVYGSGCRPDYVINSANEDATIFLKRGALSSLTFDFDEDELDFIIAFVRNLRAYNNEATKITNQKTIDKTGEEDE
jgi:transcriptional regulator with XRE-family HTH domain